MNSSCRAEIEIVEVVSHDLVPLIQFIDLKRCQLSEGVPASKALKVINVRGI